ncbi:GOLPH3/VPS74 family protein [Micromonospora aurantiaca]|uniref:GOLPH3/VPS74 family protein n=1 Tax=Micromonospora aurantiaca (nom. illeg.) TaxID=47850 RepID=UPI002E172DA8|nr:GPP34 family phosphoprotein [Micromonospora aurantiaca]
MNPALGAADEHAASYVRSEPVPVPRPAPAGAASARTGRIADEFFFMCHDDRTGRPRLFDSALAHGLAAGLLIELYYGGRITFERGHVRVTDIRPPQDWLQHLVLDRIAAEQQHTATRVWLAFLGSSAYEQVAQRMWQSGLVRPQQTGPFWRQRTLYVPTDINAAAWSWARLSQHLRNGRSLNGVDLALAGLALHTQLDTTLLDGASPAVRSHLRRLVEQSWPPLRDLLADLGSVVGGAVLSHRTS